MNSEKLRPVPVDFSLMGAYYDRGAKPVPPIAGTGSEIRAGLTGPSWCGYCGYTGRVLGPRQASCPERSGWHRWLAHNANREAWGLR